MTASVLVEPAFRFAPQYTQTLGPEVADLCSLAGFAPDPEQRLGLDLIFAMRPGNMSAAFEVGVVCSRQNLKTGLFKQAALGWLFITEQRLVVWSAHEFRTSAEAFRDLAELIEGCTWLDRRVRNIYRGNGDEAIELTTGQRLIFKTRTKGGGRGLSGDKVVLDEAMFLQPQHMGALLPTLSARPDPQVLYGASAGLAESDVLRGVRDRGRAGADPRLAYLEWCDDLPGVCAVPNCGHGLDTPGCRLDDRARWARSNPALGRRITVEYIANERRALPPAEFARERLGWWDEQAGEVPVPMPAWRGRSGAAGRPEGPVAFAVACAWPDAESASIGVAGRLGGELVVQVVEHRRGYGWVTGRMVELTGGHQSCAVVGDPAGPAGPVVAEMEAAGLDVVRVTAREAAHAFGLIRTAVLGDEADLRHFGQPELDAAVEHAHRRPLADGWVWARKGAVDISPLEAVTLAVWGHATRGHLAGEPSAYVL